jgi:hypothetical protein
VLSARLRSDEVILTERAVAALETVRWACPVLHRFHDGGGMVPANRSRMFEVRVAYELHLAGSVVEYERRPGESDMSVDFYVPGELPWFIEAFSLGKSEGMRGATRQSGLVTVLSVGDDPRDLRQSEVGELLTTQGKIAEKARKFIVPGAARHVILVDARAFLDNGPDHDDAREMVYGWDGLGDRWRFHGRVWDGKPVKGLLDKNVPLRDAPAFQERVHFVGFVTERGYREGEIRDVGHYLGNWHLFASHSEAEAAFRTYPLRPRSSS